MNEQLLKHDFSIVNNKIFLYKQVMEKTLCRDKNKEDYLMTSVKIIKLPHEVSEKIEPIFNKPLHSFKNHADKENEMKNYNLKAFYKADKNRIISELNHIEKRELKDNKDIKIKENVTNRKINVDEKEKNDKLQLHFNITSLIQESLSYNNKLRITKLKEEFKNSKAHKREFNEIQESPDFAKLINQEFSKSEILKKYGVEFDNGLEIVFTINSDKLYEEVVKPIGVINNNLKLSIMDTKSFAIIRHEINREVVSISERITVKLVKLIKLKIKQNTLKCKNKAKNVENRVSFIEENSNILSPIIKKYYNQNDKEINKSIKQISELHELEDSNKDSSLKCELDENLNHSSNDFIFSNNNKKSEYKVEKNINYNIDNLTNETQKEMVKEKSDSNLKRKILKMNTLQETREIINAINHGNSISIINPISNINLNRTKVKNTKDFNDKDTNKSILKTSIFKEMPTTMSPNESSNKSKKDLALEKLKMSIEKDKAISMSRKSSKKSKKEVNVDLKKLNVGTNNKTILDVSTKLDKIINVIEKGTNKKVKRKKSVNIELLNHFLNLKNSKKFTELENKMKVNLV